MHGHVAIELFRATASSSMNSSKVISIPIPFSNEMLLVFLSPVNCNARCRSWSLGGNRCRARGRVRRAWHCSPLRPASSPARSSVWTEATVAPSDCASLACASTVCCRPDRIISTPPAAAATRILLEKARQAGHWPLPSNGQAARTSLAHAFQFGAHLSPADRSPSDRDTLFGHFLCFLP